MKHYICTIVKLLIFYMKNHLIKYQWLYTIGFAIILTIILELSLEFIFPKYTFGVIEVILSTFSFMTLGNYIFGRIKGVGNKNILYLPPMPKPKTKFEK